MKRKRRPEIKLQAIQEIEINLNAESTQGNKMLEQKKVEITQKFEKSIPQQPRKNEVRKTVIENEIKKSVQSKITNIKMLSRSV